MGVVIVFRAWWDDVGTVVNLGSASGLWSHEAAWRDRGSFRQHFISRFCDAVIVLISSLAGVLDAPSRRQRVLTLHQFLESS